ncbi:efflux transporter outer membrane subunit [Methylomonas sp. DH-1]|uniref:efflux transporter outer membrane subunit n=1 Tax=Methylomonas sp. (strain DH-1) TaxID=1727196 RepID=UPI0007C96F37|nr:efflux transporter outer membrane subunit [Methylomonas sp. DH-1]ANE56334.1 RND transporter [Methylomonas sp. DH-1]
MAALRRFGLAVLVITIEGCALFGADSQRAQMAPLPEIEQTLARTTDEIATQDRWPEQRWWTAFGNATLNGLIETALAANPNLKVAEARLRQAETLADFEAADLYPTIDANVSFTAQRFSADSVQAKLAGQHFRHLLINPLVLRYHLDFWGRDEASLQSAVDRSLAASAELADARLLLATAVAGAYFDLLAAAEKWQLAEHIVSDLETLFRLEQSRRAAGLIGEAPLWQAERNWHAAKQTAAGLRAEQELRRNQLAALAGQGADWGMRIALDASVVPQVLALPADLPLRLLARRPDLHAARLQANAAAEDIHVAKTAFYPDVNLLAFTGFHSVSLVDIALQGSSLAYAVGPSIEFPIFEGGRLRAQLGYREAAYDLAVQRYNAGLLHAVQDVADALSHWHELAAKADEQQQALAAAEAQNRLSDSLIRNGLHDNGKLVLARIEANRERLLLAGLAAEQRKNAVSLIKALGGGYQAAVESAPQP